MSRPHKFKEQVSNTQYPIGKLLLVTICIPKYDVCTHIPEEIVELNRAAPPMDFYGNGQGKDYYGNKCKQNRFKRFGGKFTSLSCNLLEPSFN